ncbi:Putative Mitochondria protein Fmp29 [Penicillium brasilianum]|uniref:Putative Mitochondria protein Fmp29 n=1 Tax=Penicillium brasilianum TaxID=104259 RepID=A0A0F7VJV9_PENBI|nr:Putative Mitochondria protein Fmp29 [Penicillium brasilianum]
MANRLFGAISHIPYLPKIITAPRLIFARPISTIQKMPESCDLFEYTSGRWIYNDDLRHRERRRVFNVSELKRLAALAIQQEEVDVIGFEKLAEGGFNRSFLITMRDGYRFVARIPYPATEPNLLVVASEVAMLEFLRAHDIPVPKVLGYSAVANNRAGTEYIFMEPVRGQNLGGIWYTLSERERRELVARIVQLESRLFELQFPASGSLYFCKDYQIIMPESLSQAPNRPTPSALALILRWNCGTGKDSTYQLSAAHTEILRQFLLPVP